MIRGAVLGCASSLVRSTGNKNFSTISKIVLISVTLEGNPNTDN